MIQVQKYFRIGQSSEFNLFIIRLNTPSIKLSNIDLDGNIIKNKYCDPEYELLPNNFNIKIDGITKEIIINYGDIIFPNTPIINITPESENFYKTQISSFDIQNNNIKFKIFNYDNNNTIQLLDPFSNLDVSFNIYIQGVVLYDPALAIANRGWNLLNKNKTENVYTYFPVSIGTSKNNTSFTLNKTFSIKPFIITLTSDLSYDKLKKNLYNIISINDISTIELNNGFDGQIINVIVSNVEDQSFTLTIKGSSNINIYGLKMNDSEFYDEIILNKIGQRFSMIYSIEDSIWFIYNFSG